LWNEHGQTTLFGTTLVEQPVWPHIYPDQTTRLDPTKYCG